MLRIAAGLIEPDHGTVEAMGPHAARNRVRYQQLVSFLPAGDRGLYARLSVRKQLEFWARIAMLPRGASARGRARARRRSTCEELADRRVDRMSMGQRQRLRIAMTFLPRPEVVLLDEPLTSLDGEGAELLRAAIDELLARDGAVLWCSPSGERLDMRFDARWVLDRRQVGGRVSGARGHRAGVLRRAAARPARLHVLPNALGQPGADLAVQPDALLLRLAPCPSARLHLAGGLLRFVVVGLALVSVMYSCFLIPEYVRQELVAGTFDRLVLSPFGAVRSVIAMSVSR